MSEDLIVSTIHSSTIASPRPSAELISVFVGILSQNLHHSTKDAPPYDTIDKVG